MSAKKGDLKRSGLVGNEPPMAASPRARTPDRREVSLRWLAGSALTGLTSTTLMAAALFIALDGKQLLATPPEVADRLEIDAATGELKGQKAKSTRVRQTATAIDPETDRRRMSVSTVTRVGDADVVRTKPFEQVRMQLGADHKTDKPYPPFNPLNIFGTGDDDVLAAGVLGSVIYGANVETEASIRVTDFSLSDDVADDAYALSDTEAEEIVRQTAAILTDGTTRVASLHYIDPLRFGIDDPSLASIDSAVAARIVPQNVSVAIVEEEKIPSSGFSETVIDIDEPMEINAALQSSNQLGALEMASALQTLLESPTIKAGHKIRLGLQHEVIGARIVRATVYDGSEHVLTIALNDQRQFVPAREPVDPGIMAKIVKSDEEPKIAMLSERELPSAYNAIYRAVLAYDLPIEMAEKIVRMVAADVDFQSPIRSRDFLSLFFSVPEQHDEDSEHELLYVQSRFNGEVRNFYRFRTEDGALDYYDENGRSAKQFLIRNPVPNGKFRSGYGMRRHPILGYSKMHWGVDWSAPRGTPIIAPGNGTVKKAGWSNGYGKQTIITHANGYETSYSHQSRFGKGIKPGSRVRQGQVIGYIGTTGLSTGPHLHYEMRVNSKRVDPMRVRLPEGRTLRNQELARFEAERDRINALLDGDLSEPTQLAQFDG